MTDDRTTAAASAQRPPWRVEDLFATPNPLAVHYSAFRVAERLLLTGHSHQAWPDRARAGQLAAWDDAAARVDGKWEAAFKRAERVRDGFRRLLEDPGAEIALGGSTHELLVRLLSALPWRQRRRILTTTSEFHSARRQLARLGEEGVELRRLPAAPAGDIGARLAAEVDDRTALVLVSTVFFDTGEIAGGLDELAAACRRHGTPLLLDAYHQLNVVPFPLRRLGLEDAFVVGGGYKYCQLGEGNCFLRLPPGCRLRPVVTGWFAEFGQLEEVPGAGVGYAPAGAERFGGSTYDPTSHYRASEAFAFFAEQGLEPALLREVSQRQIALLRRLVDDLDLPPTLLALPQMPLEDLGGFLALASPRAGELCAALAARGVSADSRGAVLRLGPAPYLAPRQLEAAVAALGDAARQLA